MTNGKERQCDVGVLIRHHPPRQILHHAVVFVLSGAIISVEKDDLLSKAVIVEEVQPTDHSIGTLAAIICLVRQEVDLPGECLTVDSKQGTLPGCQEVDQSRLKGI